MIRQSGMAQRVNRLGELFRLISADAAEDADDGTMTAQEHAEYVQALQDAAAGLEAARAVMARALHRLESMPTLSVW